MQPSRAPRFGAALVVLSLLSLVLTPWVCGAGTEEVRFLSGEFTVVGDLRTPETEGPYPAIIMIHGDGEVNRSDSGKYAPLFDVFLRAGYAVLSWDKPGTGVTIGRFGDGAWIVTERTAILLDAIAFLHERPSIDRAHIGAWGISQGGIVIPMALTQTDDLAFAVIVSGPGVDGISQYAYLIGQHVVCEGGSEADGDLAESSYENASRATTYEEYREARTTLVQIAGAADMVGSGILCEDEWHVWDRSVDCFFDPMDAISQTTIPILAFFGELDRQVNPVRGAENYLQALSEAGHPGSCVETISGVDHNLVSATTGCLSERDRRSRTQWLQYAPQYLEIMESWLVQRADD